MRPNALSRVVWVPLIALTLGCGDAGPDLGELSEAEAASMLAALSTVWFPSPSAPSPSPSRVTFTGPTLVPETTLRQDTTDIVVSCPAGGSASVLSIDSISITIDTRINPSPDTTYATNTSYGGNTTTTTGYAGCQSTGGQGNTWTFDASPGLTFSYDIDGTIDSHSLTNQTSVISTTTNWSGLWSGSFSWSSGSRSGSCTISLTSTSATSNIDGQVSTSFTQQGQICGVAVSSQR